VSKKPRTIVGWKEKVSFPKLGLGPLIAKVDTGARSAALHADSIEIVEDRVRFTLRFDGRRHVFRAPLHGTKRIKSSNGISETRPVIRATLQLGEYVFLADVTLTSRSDMDYVMLLGRATLKGRFLVNPARSFLLDRKKELL
jgi:hypothetical protein